MRIGIIYLNSGNLFNIKMFLNFLNFKKIVLIKKKKDFKNIDILIVPGVGSFNKFIEELKKNKIFEEIKKFIKEGKSYIGICLGMQILMTKGFENVITKGINIVNGNVISLEKINHKNKIHIGWNKVIFPEKYKKLINNKKSDNFYFMHKYFCNLNLKNNKVLKTKFNNHEFGSGYIDKNLFLFQFHPEKSGKSGLNLINNILKSLNQDL